MRLFNKRLLHLSDCCEEKLSKYSYSHEALMSGFWFYYHRETRILSILIPIGSKCLVVFYVFNSFRSVSHLKCQIIVHATTTYATLLHSIWSIKFKIVFRDELKGAHNDFVLQKYSRVLFIAVKMFWITHISENHCWKYIEPKLFDFSRCDEFSTHWIKLFQTQFVVAPL